MYKSRREAADWKQHQKVKPKEDPAHHLQSGMYYYYHHPAFCQLSPSWSTVRTDALELQAVLFTSRVASARRR